MTILNSLKTKAKKLLLKLLIIFISLMLSAYTVYIPMLSDATGVTLTGQILQANGQPLANEIVYAAEVYTDYYPWIVILDTAFGKADTTDENGYFEILDVAVANTMIDGYWFTWIDYEACMPDCIYSMGVLLWISDIHTKIVDLGTIVLEE